ncbi:MAG: hypothetical protein MZV63_31855 [Marinilabiliales bacterium]|nr:hypothetical protein [Marinilabiliales bacterium]
MPAYYTVTTADLDAGKAVRTVDVTGVDPRNQPIRLHGNEVVVLGVHNPGLSPLLLLPRPTTNRLVM